jgi:hypothetical protein
LKSDIGQPWFFGCQKGVCSNLGNFTTNRRRGINVRKENVVHALAVFKSFFRIIQSAGKIFSGSNPSATFRGRDGVGDGNFRTVAANMFLLEQIKTTDT